MTRSHAFSRALRQPHVITSSFDWFNVLSVSYVIGQSNYFGFGFTTLKRKPLYAIVNVVLVLYQNYQDTVLNRSRHLYLPVVLACSLIKIVNTASLNESPILAIKPYGLNFICLTIRNLYVVLLIGNTITLMSF